MKKIGKASAVDKSDLEQKTRTLLESMSSDIKRIAEGQTATADRVAKIETAVTRLPALESAVNTISMAVMQVSGDLNHVKADLNHVKVDLNHVKTDLNHVKTDLNHVKTDLNHVKADLNHVKVDLKDLNDKVDNNLSNHDKRITKVEEKVLA